MAAARDPADLDTCYVGITFYYSADQQTLQTSVAQVFNQRGDGVIVRGAPAKVSRNDRQPHLTRDPETSATLRPYFRWGRIGTYGPSQSAR